MCIRDSSNISSACRSMDGQEKLLDYETIKAAVAGEKWATEKELAHYADYIDELSTVEIRQPGGKVKKVIDEDMRQHSRRP